MLLNHSKQFQQEFLAILNRIYHSVTHNEDLNKDFHNFNQTYSTCPSPYLFCC